MKLLQELSSKLNHLFLLELCDGNRIEAVFYRGDTLCISTQVGCAIGCAFCISGKEGFLRNLTEVEIIAQYELVRSKLPVKRIAMAGIGEPLMNWKNVEKAFWYFKNRGIGVSFYTSGHPTVRLRELLRLPHGGVTISLHSVFEKKRKALMPHGGALEEVIRTLKEELVELPVRKRRRISLAYMLLKGLNDSEEELIELAGMAKDLGICVTLLRYNKTVDEYEDVEENDYERAFLLLRSYGIRVTLSTRFRRDRIGGCGTLAVNRSLTEC